jgi:hypothetical protein
VGITKKRQAPVTVPKRDKVSPHLRLLRRDHDRLFDAFEVAHSHVNRRILELEIPGSLDRSLLGVAVGPTLHHTASPPMVADATFSAAIAAAMRG